MCCCKLAASMSAYLEVHEVYKELMVWGVLGAPSACVSLALAYARSVHMYLLGKQVKHAVATDEAEECTQDILSLIQARQVPSDSTMPLLIHDVRKNL